MYQEEGGVPVLAPRHSHQARMGPAADKLVFNHAFEQRASITKDRDQGPCSSPPPLQPYTLKPLQRVATLRLACII